MFRCVWFELMITIFYLSWATFIFANNPAYCNVPLFLIRIDDYAFLQLDFSALRRTQIAKLCLILIDNDILLIHWLRLQNFHSDIEGAVIMLGAPKRSRATEKHVCVLVLSPTSKLDVAGAGAVSLLIELWEKEALIVQQQIEVRTVTFHSYWSRVFDIRDYIFTRVLQIHVIALS